MTRQTLRKVAPAAFVLLSPLACRDSIDGPVIDSSGMVAITQMEGGQHALFLTRVSGGALTRIHFTTIADSIPGNLTDFPVTDASLKALGSPTISPTGDRIAVVATLAMDQSEVVVMNSDGTGQVASINTQAIASEPEWSPNGTKIAYVMSTVPGFGGLDLFVTDLASHTVTRLTTNARLGNAALRWSSDGRAIYASHTTGTTTTSPSDWLSEVIRVDVATKAVQTVAGVASVDVLYRDVRPIG